MSSRFPVVCLLAVVLGLPAWLPAAGKPGTAVSRFRQDRFAIGAFWLTFSDDERLDARFGEIAEANFTLVFGPVGGFTASNAAKHIKLCQKHDLRAIVLCRGVPDEQLPDGPACWGYRLWDEPNAKMFDQLAVRVNKLRQVRPGRLGYINLYPNYANDRQLGAAGYEEYVQRFLKTVDVDVLSMDHYPPFKPRTDGRRAVLLTNYRFAYTAWPTVVFDVPTGQVREVDQRTGRVRAAYDDSPDMPGLQVSLDAGEGRLFLLPAKTNVSGR